MRAISNGIIPNVTFWLFVNISVKKTAAEDIIIIETIIELLLSFVLNCLIEIFKINKINISKKYFILRSSFSCNIIELF